MIRRGHAVLPLAALAALALPAAAFCEAAGRYVPTYDAEKAWYLGELGVAPDPAAPLAEPARELYRQ